MEPCSQSRALARMKTHLELRALRPNSVESYSRHARRFLDAVAKGPGAITTTWRPRH